MQKETSPKISKPTPSIQNRNVGNKAGSFLEMQKLKLISLDDSKKYDQFQ